MPGSIKKYEEKIKRFCPINHSNPIKSERRSETLNKQSALNEISAEVCYVFNFLNSNLVDEAVREELGKDYPEIAFRVKKRLLNC